MTRYRPFRNTDPPAIAELWCNHPPHRALVQPMSPTLFEQRVLSKPYFDRHGLIVAEEEDRVIGFAHAGFGSNHDGSRPNTEIGGTCMLMVGPHEKRAQIATELLEASERYLTDHGTRTLYAGSVDPANAFYLGLYGGCQSPGILESDTERLSLFRSAGYLETERHAVVQRHLAGFRPIVDRVQVRVRRQYQVEPEYDPPPDSWWEACTIGQIERMRYLLVSRRTGEVCGSVIFWDMERISSSWGVPSIGLMRLEISSNLRGQGLGVFLVGEALRHMHDNGASLAEAQFVEGNEAAHALFGKLGFERVDRGFVLCKEI